MKIVPPSTYTEAYNRAMNLKSEQKTKKKNSSSNSDDDTPSGDESSEDEGNSKKVCALQKDMTRMMKEFKNMHKESKGNELWCTECKKEGHTKGSCPKDQFCEICQIMGHSIKECPFNLKTRAPQQVFLTQEASTSGGSGNTSTEGATSGGYRNNRRGQNNNNSGSNNNGGRSPIQYDANNRSMVQCHACNLWGHFARECTTANTPKLLCRWCGPGDHDDTKCPKSGVNLITVGTDEEEVLAITRKQAKVYLDPTEEKKRLEEARVEIHKATQAKMAHLKDTLGTSVRNCAEQNIVWQILQTEVPVRINDLLLTMPQLRTAFTYIVPIAKQPTEQGKEKEGGASAEDPVLLALSSGRYPVVVEMGILGTVLTNTIVDGGSGVNVLPEDT